VLSVAGDLAEPPPETLRGAGRELIRGVYKLDGRLLLVLDAEKAMASNGRFITNERKGHEGKS
jgi:purine-binding chemotaxis protein CheW